MNQLLAFRTRASNVLALQRHGALIALIALLVFGIVRYGDRFAGENLANLLADDAKFALVALGMTFVIMSGGIDLSVGSVALLGGVVAAQASGAGLVPAFGLAVLVGLALGSLNGVLIAKVRLEPFIVTLAALLGVRGLALYLSDKKAVVASGTGSFQDFGRWELLGLPVSAVFMFAAFLIGAAVLRYTAFGRTVLAVGGSEDAARLMGLPVARTKFVVYAMSGALAGLAGAFLAAQTGSVSTDTGIGWELSAIAAVVVGGTLLTGGVGSVMSTLVGVVLLQLIFNLIVFENSMGAIEISSFWESVIRGGFLLLVVLLQVKLSRRRASGGTAPA
ncbi:ABC transporter permease [Thermoactinospora rubra]|uniref:ABC transporter permease n=1 Tax=Thermoactinospora rubra TaxID=1088767 RepID=UPI000A11AA02|nr:ABC transporter permease [Thermoactinospora rubra]